MVRIFIFCWLFQLGLQNPCISQTLDSCLLFDERNSFFDSDKWISDSLGSNGYRFSIYGSLDLKGINRSCIIEKLGVPITGDSRFLTYIISSRNLAKNIYAYSEITVGIKKDKAYYTMLTLE
ncbi:MAG: hypothetical protein AB8E82_10520 [Aureispira sp.]